MKAPSPTSATQVLSGRPIFPPITAPTPNPIGPIASELWISRGGSMVK